MMNAKQTTTTKTTKHATAKSGAKATKNAKATKPRGAAAIQVVEDAPAVATPDAAAVAEPAKATGTKTPKASKEPKEKKLSAIDAAAQLLASSPEPLTTKQMIEQMAAKGLWTSPGGKTPHATLYSAILREITTKGAEARFKKTDRGHFASNA